MQRVECGLPGGTVILAAGVQPRYYDFQIAMERLMVPPGTKWLVERGCDIVQNFNHGLKQAVGDWVWFMGDDHFFQPDMLLKLLKWNVDIVIPPTPCKSIPFLPCIMHGSGQLDEWKEELPLYTWSEVSGQGLMPLPVGDFIGQAGMLVRRTVFKDWPYPWFKCGQQDPGKLQEDMTFCRELQLRGHTIWIDRNQILDHHFPVGITAWHHDGEWVPALVVSGNICILPDARAHRDANGRTCLEKSVPLQGGALTAPPPSRITWQPVDVDIDSELHDVGKGGGDA